MQQPSTVNPVQVAQMLAIPSTQANAPFVPAPQPSHQHQGVPPPPPTEGGLAPPGSPGRKRKFEGDMSGGDGVATQSSLSKPPAHNGPSARVAPPSSAAPPLIMTGPAAATSGPMSVPPPRGPISIPRLVPFKDPAHSIHNDSTTNGALDGPQRQQQQQRRGHKGGVALRLRVSPSSSSAPDDRSTAGNTNAMDTSKPQVAPVDTTTPTFTGPATAMPPHFQPPDGDYMEWISPRSSSSNTNTGPFLEPPCEGTPLPPAMQLPPHGASLVPRPLKTHQRQQMQGGPAMPRNHGHVSVPPPSSSSSNSYAHTGSPSAVSSLNAISSRPRGDQPPPQVEPPGRPILMKTSSGGAGHHTAPPSGSGVGAGAGNGTGGGDGIGGSIPTQQEPPSLTASSSVPAASGGVEPPQAALSREASSTQEINATGNALMGLVGATAAAAVDTSAQSPPAKKAREAENEEWVPLQVRREIMDSTINKIKQELEALKAGGLDSAVLLVWAERVVQEKERVVSNAQSFKRFMEHTTEEITKYEVAEAEATYKANLESLKENMMDERLLQIRRLEEIIRTGVAEEAVMTRVNTRNTRSKLGNVKDLDLLGTQNGTNAGGMKRKRGQSPVSAYLQKTLDLVEMEMDLCQIHSDDKLALHDPDDEDPESRPLVRVRAGRTSVTVGDLHLHKSDNIMVTVVRTDEQYHATVQSFNTQEIFLKTSGGPTHQTGRRRVALQDLAEGQVLIDLATSPPPRAVRYSDHEDGIDPPTRSTRR